MQQFAKGKPSAGAFFDSDFATIDSVLALALLHGLQGKNDCRVAMVGVSRPNLAVAGFVDAVERFYRGPAGNFSQVPPIGMPTEGKPGDTSPAFTLPFDKKKPDGTPVYVNQVKRVLETGDPNTLIRNYLEAQYDQNAFYVLAGPATNLVAALQFVPDLVAAKIKYLVASRFTSDLASARKLLAEWPSPIVVCGSDVGDELLFPGASIDKEFPEQVPNNPVADAYRAYKPMPYDTPTTAMAAALYAGRPKEGYFKLSESGVITIKDDGGIAFAASEKGKHQYLVLDPAQKERVTKTYVELASAKPVPPRRKPVEAEEPKKLPQ